MAAVSTPGINPSILVAPDYQTRLLEAQRRLELASALRQQALTDTPGNGGRVSWTQGLARALAGLSAGANTRSAYKEMKDANQAYAAGLRGMFGGNAPQTPQMAQGTPPAPSGDPTPQMPPQAPQQAPAPFVPGQQPTAGQPDPQAPLPDAPPQAASPQPPSAAPSASTGGAPGPFSLTGDQNRDMAMYVMNPDEYGKAVIGAHSPVDIAKTVQQAQEAMARGDVATATALLGNIQKQNYIAPAAARPGGWTQDPQTKQWMFHPQAPIPGAVPGPNDANGNMTWSVPAGVEDAVRERAQSQSGGEAKGKSPYQFQQVYNPETHQMELKPVSELAGTPSSGGGSLNTYYGRGGQGAPQGGAPTPAPAAGGGGHFAAAPPLGAQAAFDAYGKGQAQGAIDTQAAASTAPQVIQSYREMQRLLAHGVPTGPLAARLQHIGEEHGISFLTNENAFVFNKDAQRAIAQDAQAVGLNGSDTRLGMLASASPTQKMPAAALQQVLPVVIGLKLGVMAKAMANANWIEKNGPQSNAQFNNWWMKNYDPRVFTAIARGPDAFKAQIHRLSQHDQQFYMSKYYALRDMGVDFSQFAQ